MKRLLTLLLLAIVLIPLSARNYKFHLWADKSNTHDTDEMKVIESAWVLKVKGSDFDTWNVVNNGHVYLLPMTKEGNDWKYYKQSSWSEYESSGISKTFKNDGSADAGIKLPSDYKNMEFTFTITSNDNDYSDINLTISWADISTTSSVYLLGTINSWTDNTTQLTADGSEYKLELTKAQVNGALYNGDFYFRFIENMSNNDKYAVVPNTDQTALTVNAAYTSDTYAFTGITTDSKKDYYWKFTPNASANKYFIHFKNDDGTRSVKVTDDSPEPWYLHCNLGRANDWDGTTNYPLTLNSATGYYEYTLTESEISDASNDDVRFRVYDGSGSWGPSSGSYTFEQEEGTVEYDLTTTSTTNYISIPKGKYSSAKIEAKKDGSKVLLYVTLTPIIYYWVSPQITNGEKWTYFKMVPSRNRSRDGGDGKTSTKYFTFTMKNDDLVTWKTKSKIADGTKIQWYIERYDGSVVFRPESGEPSPSASNTSLTYDKTTDSDCGYVNYTDNYKSTTPSSRTGYFAFNKGYNDTSNSKNALAYTFMLNSDNGNVYMDYAHTSASTSVGYDLVGNFTSAKGSVDISLSNGKAMTKYWYKNGVGSTTEVAQADSIVYKVEVQKPAEGWGDLYIDVNQHGNTNWDDYSKVLRPLISLGNNLDGRALHGALTTAKSEQSLNPEPSSAYQSYTFSFNATTRTYKLEFNMPDATLSPGSEGNNIDFNNTWEEKITVNYSEATTYATAATKCYIGAGSTSAFTLDETTAKLKDSFSSFTLTYDGSTIKMDGSKVADGSTVYFKICGEDANGVKGEIHTYQYTFTSTMSFEPQGGLFINSAKISIQGGMAPYRYEIYNKTKTENGENVVDYSGTPVSSGMFSTGTYADSDNNYRISTPGWLKIIDNTGAEVYYNDVSNPFDFTYSTSENYKRNTTGDAITTVNTSDAGAYPNGADYWKAAPGDLSIQLDPTWGGKTLTDETSVVDWTGTVVPKRINTPLTQTIQGLNAGKTYTVQAIVRGLGESKKTVTLTLEGAETVTKKLNLRNGSGGSEEAADLSRQGSEVTKTGRIEYIEPLNFNNNGADYKAAGEGAYGWAKVEATVKASQAGWLTIKLEGDEWFDLSNVTLLEDANTDHGFRTTASTSATDETTYDYRDRSWKKNNAYSFFDRGKNRNAVIFADKRTVIAMDETLLADVDYKVADRRHPFNVVATNGATDTNGTTPVLYLTDMGYGSDANNPVDTQIGETSWEKEYNSEGYRKSGYTFKPGLPFKAKNVVFDRKYGNETKRQTTIVLPFDMTKDELHQFYGNDATIWIYKSYDAAKRSIVFEKVTDGFKANTPYIMLDGVGSIDSRLENKGVSTKTLNVTSTTLGTVTSDAGFTGTYKFVTIERGDEQKTHYGYNASTGQFQIVSYSGAAFKPFRAYYTLPIPCEAQTTARALTVYFADITTGMTHVEQATVEPNDVYTLGGVRIGNSSELNRLPKGVYIMNGKKVIK